MPFQAPSERKFCILSVTPMCPKCALCSSSGMLACKLIHPRSHGHTHFPGNLISGQPLKIGNTNYHGSPFFQQGGVVFVPILRSRSRYVSKRFKTCAFISALIIQAPFRHINLTSTYSIEWKRRRRIFAKKMPRLRCHGCKYSVVWCLAQ